MRDTMNMLLTLLIALAAAAVGLSAIKGSFFPPRPSDRESTTPYLLDKPEWSELIAVGLPGDDHDDAEVTILVFSDLECPACRGFHQTLSTVVAQRRDVNPVYLHYPLSYHRFARPAARAWECAAALGATTAWADVIY